VKSDSSKNTGDAKKDHQQAPPSKDERPKHSSSSSSYKEKSKSFGLKRDLKDIKCRTCGKMGHYANHCPVGVDPKKLHGVNAIEEDDSENQQSDQEECTIENCLQCNAESDSEDSLSGCEEDLTLRISEELNVERTYSPKTGALVGCDITSKN